MLIAIGHERRLDDSDAEQVAYVQHRKEKSGLLLRRDQNLITLAPVQPAQDRLERFAHPSSQRKVPRAHTQEARNPVDRRGPSGHLLVGIGDVHRPARRQFFHQGGVGVCHRPWCDICYKLLIIIDLLSTTPTLMVMTSSITGRRWCDLGKDEGITSLRRPILSKITLVRWGLQTKQLLRLPPITKTSIRDIEEWSSKTGSLVQDL